MPSERSITTRLVPICSQKPLRVDEQELVHRVGARGERRDVERVLV